PRTFFTHFISRRVPERLLIFTTLKCLGRFFSILVQPIRNKAAKSEGFLVICLGSLVFIIFLGENG
ncbi:MAG: hypothetical protein P8N01_01815, partial [Burkholderiales bacterium]|nr:hypothetical protein [Burkholderiales bacterium]